MCENLSQVGSRPSGKSIEVEGREQSQSQSSHMQVYRLDYIALMLVIAADMKSCPIMACAATGPCARSGGEGAAHGSGDEGQGAGSKCHGRAGLRTPHSS